MFKHITVKKKLSVFVVALFIVSLATGTYFSYDQGYAHGYIQGLAQAGGTPTIDGTVGIYDMPWVNGTAANFEEFYLNDVNKTGLLTQNNFVDATSYVGFDASLSFMENYFLCDGTNGKSAIEAAIAFCNALGGGTVFIENGDYTQTGNHVIEFVDNLHIIGESMENTIIGSTDGQWLMRIISDDNVSIEELTITSNTGGANQMNLHITSDPEYVVIRRVKFEAGPNNIDWAINIVSASKVSISECVVNDENVLQFVYASGNLSESRIFRNLVKDTNIGIYLRGSQDVSIFDNILIDAADTLNMGAILVSNHNPHNNLNIIGNKIKFTEDPTAAINGIAIAGETSGTNMIENVVISENNIISEVAVTSNIVSGVYIHGKNSAQLTCRSIIVSDNVFIANGYMGRAITLTYSEHIIVNSNIIRDTDLYGIWFSATDYSIAENNIIDDSGNHGIYLEAGDYNSACLNTISNSDGYGISVSSSALSTLVKENQLINNTSGAFNDAGTDTKLAVISFQFTEPIVGSISTSSPTGVDVDAITEGAALWGQLPIDLQQVVRIKIWAVSTGTPINVGGQMHLEIIFNCGASLEDYNLGVNSWSLTNYDSEEADYSANKILHWLIEDGDVGNELSNLFAGDSFEITVLYEGASDPDGATDAIFRILEIEYV